jgi:hypothetical protein
MRAPFELRMLAELRARGQAPKLPIWLVNDRVFAKRIIDSGELAILIVSDQWSCDWSPLAGLAVIISTSFDATPVGTRLALAIRDAKPYSVWTWSSRHGFSTMAMAPCAPMDREDAA